MRDPSRPERHDRGHQTSPGSTVSRSTIGASGTGRRSKEQLTSIRDWARKNGYSVSDRGRIPSDVLEAYDAAH